MLQGLAAEDETNAEPAQFKGANQRIPETSLTIWSSEGLPPSVDNDFSGYALS
ncbi:MAG: hypothetical protein P8N63_04895 [Pseudomonadales bacterium]|nr:hypothetical protein [Pseudomonadales bacterium]